MECKLCEHEKQISKYFKHAPHIKVCDACLETMNYNMSEVAETVKHEFEKNFNKNLTRAVQTNLPTLIEKLLVESGLEFELKVI